MDIPLNPPLSSAPASARGISSAWKTAAAAGCLALIGVLIASLLLGAASGFVSNDDYYHSRLAAQIIEQRTLRLNFPWLPHTILSPEQFVDHHLLYHIYLAPWMYWGGMAGAKFAQALIIGALLVACWSLLRSLQVRHALLWSLGLFALSIPFLYRLLMVRTQAAALLLLILALQLLFRQRYRWLIALAFAFTWLYNGFILLPAVVALYTAAIYITGGRRIVWQPLAYVALGTALGLVINPYFPRNITFILNHLGEKVDIESNIRVGTEWYPYTTAALLDHSAGAFILLALGFLAPGLRRIRRDAAETTLLLIALMTLYMLAESRRFIEYFPAFALLFAAVALGRRDIRWGDYLPTVIHKLRLHRLYLLPFAAVILWSGWQTVSAVYADAQTAEEEGYMAGAAQWLQTNTQAGELVFQTDWDDFPYLFYYNTHNTYLVGMDPTYLQLAQPTLWNLWLAVTQGIVERPSVLIQESFGARYVVSDRGHDAFAVSATADPAMHLVYEDATGLIWYISDTEAEK